MCQFQTFLRIHVQATPKRQSVVQHLRFHTNAQRIRAVGLIDECECHVEIGRDYRLKCLVILLGTLAQYQLTKKIFLHKFAKFQNGHVDTLPQDVPIAMRTGHFVVEKQVILDRIEQTSKLFVAQLFDVSRLRFGRNQVNNVNQTNERLEPRLSAVQISYDQFQCRFDQIVQVGFAQTVFEFE